MSRFSPDPDPDARRDEVVAAFRQAFDREPEGVWVSPGRVNLIGEHVDYNGGLCLPMALPQGTVVALARRDDDAVRLVSAGQEPWHGRLPEVAPGTVTGWASYAVGVAWALAHETGTALPGFDAAVTSTVPIGAGLSSSAALECAVGLALAEINDLRLVGSDAGRARLAAACIRAENEIAGAPTGGMDQTTSLRARAGHALEIDCRDFAVRHIPLDADGAGLSLLVTDTRAHHALTDGQYGSRREVCERAAARLGVGLLAEIGVEALPEALATLERDDAAGAEAARRVRHVVTEIDRVRRAVDLLLDGRVRRLGALFSASHASMRDDYEISCPELDLAVEAAEGAGALGARMTGGGFGGSTVALVESAAVPAVADAVTAAFRERGFTEPRFLLARPSDAGHRIG